MEDAEGGVNLVIPEIGIKLVEMMGDKHALVDDCARGKGTHVQRSAEPLLDGAAGKVQDRFFSLQRNSGGVDQQVPDAGHALASRFSERIPVDRDIAPAAGLQPEPAKRLFNTGFDLAVQEEDAHGEVGRGDLRQAEPLLFSLKKGPWHLEHDAGAVSRLSVRSDGAPVRQVLDRLDAHRYDGMAPCAPDVADKSHATGG